MITILIKEHKPDIYQMIQKHSSAKSLLKQMDSLWKRLEVLLEKQLRKQLGK